MHGAQRVHSTAHSTAAHSTAAHSTAQQHAAHLLEQARLHEAADEDPDIAEALEELREQLNESKREKLEELQGLEQAERRLGTELGVNLAYAETAGTSAAAAGTSAAGRTSPVGGGGGKGGSSGGGGGGGMDSSTQLFVKSAQTLWKRLESSSIEKVNVGQQEALGVKDLIKLSNEQIDTAAHPGGTQSAPPHGPALPGLHTPATAYV